MKIKSSVCRRMAAMLLTLVMLLSVLPTAALAAGTAAPLEKGSYTVPVKSLTCAAPLKPVQDAFAKAFGESIRVDVADDGAMTATIHPQHMVVDMKPMGQYHCNVLTVKDATYPEMQTVKYSPGMSNELKEIQAPKIIVVDLPQPQSDGSFELSITVDFMNDLLGQGKDHPTDVMLTLDFANAKPIQAANPVFGSKKVPLAPGKYDLPVSFMKEDDITTPSMAGSCVKGGELEVMADGSAFLTLQLGPVKVMFVTGWASQWQIYQGDPKTSEKVLAQVMSKDTNGHETAVRFQLPDTSKDGVFVSMYVDVMKKTNNGYLALDFAKAELQTPDKPQPQPTAPAAPVIAPAAGSFTDSVTVNITAEKGAVIHYTTDGTAPTVKSPVYTKALTLTETTTVKAVAVRDELTSKVAQATYTKEQPAPDNPQPVVKTGSADVSFGAAKAYDVTAAVSVLDEKITAVEFTHTAEASGHASSAAYADKAAAGMKDKFNTLSVTDQAAIAGVDTVSGATITSDACKTAVLKALDLYEEPQPENPESADLTFGSTQVTIQPGTYEVPISLRNSSRHEDASMAASAFPTKATLTVAEDGTATLTTTMEAVTIKMGETMEISDMAHSVLVYQGNDLKSDTVAATVLETTKKPQNMPMPGTDVPTKISFQIPNNDWDGVYINFAVDAMGPGYPDGWLRIDYAAIGQAGKPQTHTGSAKVDQFGKYTIDAEVTVTDGLISNVAVSARDFISETHRPTNEMKIAQVTEALQTTWNGMAPTQDNAEKIYRAIMKEDEPSEVIDTVSGATYSAKAVRDAVMNAFDLKYQDEVIHVPESVEPGIYEVEIGYYSDIVLHSLVENEKTTARLTVNADGTMSLDFETRSGTDKEPLYILAFNGVYENNDRTAKLTMDGCSTVMGLSSNDYEDEFFTKGTQVVNHVTFPLLGGLSKVYNTNATMYVPAMKGLNGELSGVHFENGTFAADVFAKIYWDTMKRVGEVPGYEPEKIADGNYYVDAYLWHETKDETSMGDTALKDNRKVLVTFRDGIATNVQVATAPVTMPPFVSAITGIQVDGKDVEVLQKGTFVSQPMGNEHEYIRLFQFTLPDCAQPTGLSGATMFPVSFVVPDTPMGSDPIHARLKLDWSSAEKTDDTQIGQPDEPSAPQYPAVDLVDKATGVKVHAGEAVFTEEVRLVVERIIKGETYDQTAAIVSGVGNRIALYTIRFVGADGKEVQPKGPVTVSIPMEDMGEVSLFRINPNGTKTMVRGHAEDGYFVFMQKNMGLYALVETAAKPVDPSKPADPSNPTAPDQNNGANKPTDIEKPQDGAAPQTGDTMPVMLLLATLAVSGAALSVLVLRRRKENK